MIIIFEGVFEFCFMFRSVCIFSLVSVFFFSILILRFSFCMVSRWLVKLLVVRMFVGLLIRLWVKNMFLVMVVLFLVLWVSVLGFLCMKLMCWVVGVVLVFVVVLLVVLDFCVL